MSDEFSPTEDLNQGTASKRYRRPGAPACWVLLSLKGTLRPQLPQADRPLPTSCWSRDAQLPKNTHLGLSQEQEPREREPLGSGGPNPPIQSQVGVHVLSRVQLSATPWTVARQAPLSMGFPRQGYWSGLPFHTPGDLPDPGIELECPALAGGFFTTNATLGPYQPLALER